MCVVRNCTLLALFVAALLLLGLVLGPPTRPEFVSFASFPASMRVAALLAPLLMAVMSLRSNGVLFHASLAGLVARRS